MPACAAEDSLASPSITTVTESALSGLWTALQRRSKFGDYGAPEFYVEFDEAPGRDPIHLGAIRVTGIVWFSALTEHAADIYRIAAFKGGGVALERCNAVDLHNFCAKMRTRGFRQLRVSMKSCIVKRGAWLQSLGWVKTQLGRTGANVRDGDILTFDLQNDQNDTLDGDDQPEYQDLRLGAATSGYGTGATGATKQLDGPHNAALLTFI